MNKQNFIDQFTDRFSVIFYFAKLNRSYQDRLIQDDVEWDKKKNDWVYKKDGKTELEIRHCATLWLIDELIKRDGVCLQKKLRSLIAWKFSRSKNTPTKILNRLLAIRYIQKGKGKKDMRGNVVELTPLGKAFLAEMKDARRENVSTLLDLLRPIPDVDEEEILRLDESNYSDAIILFDKLSRRAWNRMLPDEVADDGCHS